MQCASGRSVEGDSRAPGDEVSLVRLNDLVVAFARRFGLSERESLVVLLLAQGQAPKDISVTMDCAVATVRVYWLRIRRKTRLESPLQCLSHLLLQLLDDDAKAA